MSFMTQKDAARHRALQKEFDAAMKASARYEKLSSSWFVPVWPFALALWGNAHRKATRALRDMRTLLSRYPAYAEIIRVANELKRSRGL